MPKETLHILFKWTQYVVLHSFLYTTLIATLLTVLFYMYKGRVELSSETYTALFIIFESVFSILLYLITMLFFVLSIKKFHKKNIANYSLVVLSCQKEALESVSADDAFKVARRWLAISMWVLIAMITIISSIAYLFTSGDDMFSWMHYLIVYILFILSAVTSFFVLLYRCKKVEIQRC